LRFIQTPGLQQAIYLLGEAFKISWGNADRQCNARKRNILFLSGRLVFKSTVPLSQLMVGISLLVFLTTFLLLGI